MKLLPTQAPEHLGMQTPGPGDSESLEKAQNHLREAFRAVQRVCNAIESEEVTQSPAQVSLRACKYAIEFAGVSLSDSIDGARRANGGAS